VSNAIIKRAAQISSLLFLATLLGRAENSPLNERVLVVYNASVSESRSVAEYYMGKRSIPQGNSCKIKTDATEIVQQDEFVSHVKNPIQKCLEQVGKDKILYIVFSYLTPFVVTINGQNYALDSFIADVWDEFLPFRPAGQGDVQPYFGNAQSEGNLYQRFVSLSAYRESAGARHIYSVWRIDATTAALAKGLVDKALFAEAHGLSGKGCFDLTAPAQGLADSGYGAGNWDIYRAEQFVRKAGFPILDDTHEQEFGTPPAPLRCDGAALYAGWYSLNHYNDAFTWNPGAIGIHLDSASALSTRGGASWVSNALIKGITVTSGAVAEPYLDNLPHPDQAFLYILEGANVGDAIPRSTRLLKWMILNAGDPLYRPFPNGIHSAMAHTPDLVFALLPPMALGGGTSAGIIGLNAPAPEGGLNFSVTTNRPDLLDVPANVSIAAGADGVKFPIRAKAVHDDNTTARIFVSAKDLAGSNTLVLFPVLAPLAVNPARIRGLSSATGAVLLRHPAPSPGITVALSASNPSVVNVPSEVTVAEGQNKATFPITTRAVIAQNSIAITASYEGVNRTATLTVVP